MEFMFVTLILCEAIVNIMYFFILLPYKHLVCISLVKSKIGLLREITRILFCERNKKIRKGINRGLIPAKETKNPKTDFSIYTASCLF